MLEQFLMQEKGHTHHVPLTKIPCELDPIEHVWAQAKHYSCAHCLYTLASLQHTVNLALDSVTLESVQNHFRKVGLCMFAYLKGTLGESELEKLVKNYKDI